MVGVLVDIIRQRLPVVKNGLDFSLVPRQIDNSPTNERNLKRSVVPTRQHHPIEQVIQTHYHTLFDFSCRPDHAGCLFWYRNDDFTTVEVVLHQYFQYCDQVGYFGQWGHFSFEVLSFAIDQLVSVYLEYCPTLCWYVWQVGDLSAWDLLLRVFGDRSLCRHWPYVWHVFSRAASGDISLDRHPMISSSLVLFILLVDKLHRLFTKGFGDDLEDIMILIEQLLKGRYDSLSTPGRNWW